MAEAGDWYLQRIGFSETIYSLPQNGEVGNWKNKQIKNSPFIQEYNINHVGLGEALSAKKEKKEYIRK